MEARKVVRNCVVMLLVLIIYCFTYAILRENLFWGKASFRLKDGEIRYSLGEGRIAEIYGTIKYRGKEHEFLYITTASKVTEREIWEAEGLVGETQVNKVKVLKISPSMEKEHNIYLLLSFIIGLPVMALISIGICEQIDEKFERRADLWFND